MLTQPGVDAARATHSYNRETTNVYDEARTHFVYRIFDADDRLLYVGSTRRVALRVRQHELRQEWGAEIVRFTQDGPFRRFTALAVEARAIQYEQPLHNQRRRLYWRFWNSERRRRAGS